MAYGFQVLNNNGFVQFDTTQDLKHLVKVQSYTIAVGARTLRNYSYSFSGSAYGNNSGPIVKSPPSGLGSQVVIYSGSVQQRYFRQKNILMVRPSSRSMYPCAIGWSSTGDLYCYSQTSGSFIIDEYEYSNPNYNANSVEQNSGALFAAQVAALGNNRHALQVYDSNENVTFDSGMLPTRVAGVNSLTHPKTLTVPPSGLLNNKLDKSLHIFDASPFPDSGEDHEFPQDEVKTVFGLRWAESSTTQDICHVVELVAEYGYSDSPDYVQYSLFNATGSTPIVLNSGTASQTQEDSSDDGNTQTSPTTPTVLSVTGVNGSGTTTTTTTESNSRTFEVVTANIPNGTNLTWTINNSTTSNSDWSQTTGTVQINSQSGSFTVTTSDDSLVEGNETYSITVSGTVSGTSVSRTSGTQTIVDNDTTLQGTLSINASNFIEGGSDIVFTASTNSNAAFNIHVTRNSGEEGTGELETPHVSFTGTSKTHTVSITNDSVKELGWQGESFTASLRTGETIGQGTVLSSVSFEVFDDDGYTTLVAMSGLSGSNYTITYDHSGSFSPVFRYNGQSGNDIPARIRHMNGSTNPIIKTFNLTNGSDHTEAIASSDLPSGEGDSRSYKLELYSGNSSFGWRQGRTFTISRAVNPGLSGTISTSNPNSGSDITVTEAEHMKTISGLIVGEQIQITNYYGTASYSNVINIEKAGSSPGDSITMDIFVDDAPSAGGTRTYYPRTRRNLGSWTLHTDAEGSYQVTRSGSGGGGIGGGDDGGNFGL